MSPRCRACNAEIEWVLTEGGKRMPLDVEPRDDGNLLIVSNHGSTPVVRYVTAGDGNRVSHFATCPGANEFRRG